MNIASQIGEMLTWDDTTPEASTTTADYKDGLSTYESYIKTRAYTYGETWGDKIGYSSQFVFGNIHADAVTGDIGLVCVRDRAGGKPFHPCHYQPFP